MTMGRLYKVAGSIALCGVIWILGEKTYHEYRAMQDEPVLVGISPAASVDSLPPAEEPAVTLPALEELAATIERPMFSPSRRPFEPAVNTVQPVSSSVLELDLVGIVIWQGQRIALIRSGGDPRIIRIEEGGNVAGWVAIGIEPESVRFQNGEAEREVRLKYVNRDNSG